VLCFAYIILRGGFKLTVTGWHKLVFANRNRAIKDFNKGIIAYVLEDYQQAEHLLVKCADAAQAQQPAYLLAASAASKQQLAPNTKHYLSLLSEHNKTSKVVGIDSVIVKIKLLLNHQQDHEARQLLDDYHQHLGHDVRLLQLEMDLCLTENRFESAVEHLILARKQKTLPSKTLDNWEEQGFWGLFNELICQYDQEKLTDYWQKLPRKIKQKEAVLFAYFRVLAQHKIVEPLHKLLLPVLKKDTSEQFLTQLKTLQLGQTASQVEDLITAVQKHLHKDQHSAKWLTCLGHLALTSCQWAMAERAFHSLFHLENQAGKPVYDKQDLQGCAKALSEQGKYQQANTLLNQILAD
jgi:HemY protein